MPELNKNPILSLKYMRDSTQLEVLKPHVYPIWIWGFFIIIITLVAINFYNLPYYIENARYTHVGKQSLKQGNLDEAINNFDQVADNLRLSKEIKLKLAKLLFERNDSGDIELALNYLTDLSLTEQEFDNLSEVMSDDLKSLFHKEER